MTDVLVVLSVERIFFERFAFPSCNLATVLWKFL